MVGESKGQSTKVSAEIGKLFGLKVNKEVEGRFCIVDDTDLLFMLLRDDEVHPSYDLGIWINSPKFITVLKEMFLATYDKLK